MGEVLQGPWAGRSDDDGAGRRRSAPSRRGAGHGSVASEAPGEPSGVQAVPAVRGQPHVDEEAEPRWAVPGVDDPGGEAPEPLPRSKRAENVALAALTRHDASEAEIRAKLVAKGIDEADVDGELERLRRVGLVDDAAFAARLVDRLRERKGLGDAAIRSALRGRLVPQAVVDQVLVEQAEEPEQVIDRLHEVAADRARRLGSLPYDVAERRLAAYLMRKGYSGSAVREATREALAAAGLH